MSKISHNLILTALVITPLLVNAKVTEQEAAELGKSLTPLGAIAAANDDGSIPAWSDADAPKSAGDLEAQVMGDKILFTITKDNHAQHKDKLSAGQVAMFNTYDDFKMNIYPTRRSAHYPEEIYRSTVRNASNAELDNDGNGLKNVTRGIPFPIPKAGVEVIWNHMTRFRGKAVKRTTVQATPTREGDYTLVKMQETVDFVYGRSDLSDEEIAQSNLLAYFRQKVIAPARLAGTALLVHETLNQVKQARLAWTYNTGQRRVRRAPQVAYDAPGTASDGMRTNDDFDIFNGAPDRYNWTLVGRKEMYIPYNSHRLKSRDNKYSDIIKPRHINPELVRYEKHRVWVVEATLKEGARHIYKKRTFYLDEDSWQISLTDIYDNRDELWRVGMAFVYPVVDQKMVWTAGEAFYDLQAGRYLVMSLTNAEPEYDYGTERSAKDYTPAALRRAGVR